MSRGPVHPRAYAQIALFLAAIVVVGVGGQGGPRRPPRRSPCRPLGRGRPEPRRPRAGHLRAHPAQRPRDPRADRRGRPRRGRVLLRGHRVPRRLRPAGHHLRGRGRRRRAAAQRRGAWVLVNDDAYALDVGPLQGHSQFRGGNSGLSVWLPAPLPELRSRRTGPARHRDRHRRGHPAHGPGRRRGPHPHGARTRHGAGGRRGPGDRPTPQPAARRSPPWCWPSWPPAWSPSNAERRVADDAPPRPHRTGRTFAVLIRPEPRGRPDHRLLPGQGGGRARGAAGDPAGRRDRAGRVERRHRAGRRGGAWRWGWAAWPSGACGPAAT